eukprot:1504633-Prymnesium_polylepis.1
MAPLHRIRAAPQTITLPPGYARATACASAQNLTSGASRIGRVTAGGLSIGTGETSKPDREIKVDGLGGVTKGALSDSEKTRWCVTAYTA